MSQKLTCKWPQNVPKMSPNNVPKKLSRMSQKRPPKLFRMDPKMDPKNDSKCPQNYPQKIVPDVAKKWTQITPQTFQKLSPQKFVPNVPKLRPKTNSNIPKKILNINPNVLKIPKIIPNTNSKNNPNYPENEPKIIPNFLRFFPLPNFRVFLSKF